MSDFYSDLSRYYDEAEGSSGFGGDPLPTGWYYLKIEKVLETGLSKNGVPQARLQLQVVEGPCQDQRAFVSLSLGAKETNDDGSNRSKEELDKANKNIVNMIKGFMKAVDVTTGAPVGPFPENVFNFYSVPSWEGRAFVGKIKLQPAKGQYDASNRLNAYHNINDEDKGLAWLRGKYAGSGGAAIKAETV